MIDMAIVTPYSRCALCGELLLEDDLDVFFFPAVGLSMDFMVEYIEYTKFDDNGVHQKCIQSWGKAPQFVRFWNEYVKTLQNSENIQLTLTDKSKLKYVAPNRSKST
ncbi:hypothetical protein KFE80_00300 [bacterium SCSIO 12696]|nr:hypothetical protein KFE80_00300 [bacterium SCSIO 12696]